MNYHIPSNDQITK